MIHFFSSLLSIFFLSRPSLEGTIPLAQRTIVFEDFHQGKKIHGSISKHFPDTTLHVCAAYCLQDPDCLSFTYCYPKTCYLNKQDVFSTGVSLEGDEKCQYFGMKRDSWPNCRERGITRNIQNDDYPNFCETNFKRVDTEWGDWVDAKFLDVYPDLKRGQSRDCFLGAHGGKGSCDGNDTHVTQWFKIFFKEKFSFDEAEARCLQEGGWLKYMFYGGTEQIGYLNSRADDQCFWTGLKTDDPTVWNIINEGVPVDILPWGDNQPEKVAGKDRVAAVVDENGAPLYLTTFAANGASCAALCEMPKN